MLNDRSTPAAFLATRRSGKPRDLVAPGPDPDAFGAAPERIVGFVFIGTPSRPLEERPRPAIDRIVSHW
jgi:hypothetical protein